jgi:hypothetical protein
MSLNAARVRMFSTEALPSHSGKIHKVFSRMEECTPIDTDLPELTVITQP